MKLFHPHSSPSRRTNLLDPYEIVTLWQFDKLIIHYKTKNHEQNVSSCFR
jgi:hypothetical protein